MSTPSVTCPICKSSARYDFSSRDLMFNHYERYNYFKCIDCNSVFQHPMPNDDEINSFYPASYSVFDEKSQPRKISPLKQAIYWRNHGYTHLKPTRLFKLLATVATPFYTLDKPNYIKQGVLLDVGCGNGQYLSTMRSLGWSIQGVELSENGLKACKAAGLPVHHGDLASAVFPDESFDVITVRHVIEHIPNTHSLMAELARILKPNGQLIIETPNNDALGRSYLGANWYANDVPRHLILFSIGSLSRLASTHGLRLSKHWFDTSPKIILNSLDYITENKSKPSKKIKWKRFLARIYILLSRYTQQGDTIHTIFVK